MLAGSLSRGLSLLLISLLLILTAAAFVGGCSQREQRLNVLLITLDTLRADHLGCYGRKSARSPNIDALAADGIVYENAFAPIPSTLPSHASILTGLYPHQHGVRDNGVYFLPEEQVTLAEILADDGYATGAFVSAYVLDSRFGIGQGFSVHDNDMESPLADRVEPSGRDLPEYSKWWMDRQSEPYQRVAGNTACRAGRWIGERDEGTPFFCWVHLFDPHMPYAPPPPWLDKLEPGYSGRMDGTIDTVMAEARKLEGQIRNEDLARMVELYDLEISYLDHELGKLLAHLDAAGARENTLIVLAADHGEAFGEHLGICFEHNTSVFDEVLHVPLVVVEPSGQGAGTRDRSLSSLVDIFPTVLDALERPVPAGLPGLSLRGRNDRSTEKRAVYFEALCSKQAIPFRNFFRGVRTRDWKLAVLFDKEDENRRDLLLFENRKDPLELNNLAAEVSAHRSQYESLKSSLQRLIGLSRVDERNPAAFWPMNDEDRRSEAMRALGYVR